MPQIKYNTHKLSPFEQESPVKNNSIATKALRNKVPLMANYYKRILYKTLYPCDLVATGFVQIHACRQGRFSSSAVLNVVCRCAPSGSLSSRVTGLRLRICDPIARDSVLRSGAALRIYGLALQANQVSKTLQTSERSEQDSSDKRT